MSYYSRLNKAFADAPALPLSDYSKYVLFSDCHRGVGTSNDNFLKNRHLYMAALQYYNKKGFTYIELGDGDELWENRSANPILSIHEEAFSLLQQYYTTGRLHLIYGNHDRVKGAPYQKFPSVFPDLSYVPAIILKDIKNGKDLYLTHGHQADFLNCTLWKLARFLVRYVWKPLEYFGFLDPTSAAKNNEKRSRTERRLLHWATDEQHILISGHTHRPSLGHPDTPYCNTGSCAHPYGITCIELVGRCMYLVKWSTQTHEDGALYAARSVLTGPAFLDDFLSPEP